MLSGSSEFLNSFIEVLLEKFRRVVLSVDYTADYVFLLGKRNLHPQCLKGFIRSFFNDLIIISCVDKHANASKRKRCRD